MQLESLTETLTVAKPGRSPRVNRPGARTAIQFQGEIPCTDEIRVKHQYSRGRNACSRKHGEGRKAEKGQEKMPQSAADCSADLMGAEEEKASERASRGGVC
eukprot:581466-Pleurochrysis_carterae.AAC.4